VSPVKYERIFFIPEDSSLHSHRCENLKSYIIRSCLSSLLPEITIKTGRFIVDNLYFRRYETEFSPCTSKRLHSFQLQLL
jgi:hypothetical protein